MDKEKWIEQIIQSAKDIQPVEANPFLHTRIEAKLQQNEGVQIPVRWALASVFMIALLLLLNVSVWKRASGKPEQSGLQEFVQEFGWHQQNSYSLNY